MPYTPTNHLLDLQKLCTVTVLSVLSSTQDTGRKKKVKKDPNAPKKPLSAYMLWLQENRPMIKEEIPGASLGEIGKRAGEMWKALDDKSVSFYHCQGLRDVLLYYSELYWECRV